MSSRDVPLIPLDLVISLFADYRYLSNFGEGPFPSRNNMARKMWVKDRINLVPYLAGDSVPLRKDAIEIGKVGRE